MIRSYSVSHPDSQISAGHDLHQLVCIGAIAYLASSLSYKLRQVDLELQDKSGALENLQAVHENIIHSMRGGLITTGSAGKASC